MTKEKISAWLDGELSESDANAMMAALDTPQGRACWDEWHRIGDVLRSSELDLEPSPEFSRKLAERLAAEPHWLLPATAKPAQPGWRQKMWPGMAIAAGLVAILAVPVSHLGDGGVQQGAVVASSPVAASVPGATLVNLSPNAAQPPRHQVVISREGDSEIMRDPKMYQYLLAHQRFAPGMYSAAQYGRPVTVIKNGTDK